MEQVQKVKATGERAQDEVEPLVASPTESDAPSKDATEELLDEIDSILESNAVDFVRDYVQRGGE